MPVVKTKPTSPGRRAMVKIVTPGLFKGRPVDALTESQKRGSGRNNLGHITTRHKGGGHKAHYRIVDFRRNKIGIPARVEAIAYDPNRSANLALLKYVDGEKRYILAPQGLKVNDAVMSGPEAEPSVGNCLPLALIPLGLAVHNIELVPGQGGKMARSAGNSCQVMARDGDFVTLRLPSGEVRRILAKCMATIGQVGNADWSSINLGKAGRKRWMGIRPTVRGVAMNPVDHPMGGGEGRTSGGSHPRSPWGKLSKGGKTRNRRKTSSRFIVKRRK